MPMKWRLSVIFWHWNIRMGRSFYKLFRRCYIWSSLECNINIIFGGIIVWVINLLSFWSNSYHRSTEAFIVSSFRIIWRLRIMYQILLILNHVSIVKYADRWAFIGICPGSHDWANWLWIFVSYRFTRNLFLISAKMKILILLRLTHVY